MTVINLNERRGNGGSSEDRVILPTDMYRMKVVDAKVEDDTYDKNKDGSPKAKIVLTWEVSVLTEDQQEAMEEAEEDWTTVRIWTRFNPYYGDVKDGGPSKFKAFIDSLRDQGLLPNFNLEAFDVEDLIDIEQKCSVEEYKKTMGPNAGQPGNKINAYAPVRAGRKSGKTIAIQQDAPAQNPDPATVEAARPQRRNVPQALPPMVDDTIPF